MITITSIQQIIFDNLSLHIHSLFAITFYARNTQVFGQTYSIRRLFLMNVPRRTLCHFFCRHLILNFMFVQYQVCTSNHLKCQNNIALLKSSIEEKLRWPFGRLMKTINYSCNPCQY